MNINRRAFARYPVPSNAICLGRTYARVKGWLKDISRGGMAFEYTPIDDCEPKPKIRLILAGDAIPFYLPDVTCKTVYDVKVNNDDRPFKGTGRRQCGLQFERLDAGMKDQLALLLSSDILRPAARK